MAVVEEPAVLVGLEPCRSLTDTDLADMKNTARKSTAKPAKGPLIEKLATSSDVITNGIIDNHVSNGNESVSHKRSVEPEVGNPAKAARLHIEEMEKAQDEMTRKLSRDEAVPVPQNGEAAESNSSHDSKQSQNSKTSLVLTADVRNNFKGILDVAMNKIGSRRRSSNDSYSSNTKEITNQPSKDLNQQQSSELDEMVNETSQEILQNSVDITLDKLREDVESTTNEPLAKSDVTLEKTERTEKSDVVDENEDTTVQTVNNSHGQSPASESQYDLTKNKDNVSENTNDKNLDSMCDDGNKNISKEQNETHKNTSDDETAQTEDVLLGTDGDIEGDVDDAVLLSEDDDCIKEGNSKDTAKGTNSEKDGNDKDNETSNVNKSNLTEKNDATGEQTKNVSPEGNTKANELDSENKENVTNVDSDKDLLDKPELNNTESTKNKSVEPTKEGSIDLDSPEQESSEGNSTKPIEGEKTAHCNDSVVIAVNVKGVDVPVDSIINLDDDDDDNHSQGPDNPIEIEDDADMDNKSEESDVSRKRNATSPVPSDASSTTKKSRLDKVIGRLGSAIGMKSGETADKDGALGVNNVKSHDIDTGEKLSKSDVAEGKKNSSEGTAEVSSTRNDLTPETKLKSLTNKENIITATASEINGLLVTRMNAYFNQTRDSVIVQYQRQIGELQAAVESWRAQAKRLARQLDEQRLAMTRNPRKKRRNNSEDSVKNVQLQAANIQQHGGAPGGKVLGRQGPRTPPRTPSMGATNNVKHNATGPQIRPMTAAQAAQAAAQGKTVRDLLDKQRSDSSSSKVLIQGGRIISSVGQLVQRGGTLMARSPGGGTAIRSAHPGGKSVIDLTDDDDRRAAPQTPGRAGRDPPAPGGAVRGAAPPGGRQGAVLVQQLANNNGPVIVQQVMTSQSVRAPPGTAYVYTTRPGTLSMQTAPGTSLVRATPMTSAAPPALRPASQSVSVTRMASPATLTRPPPPLRSAPSNANSAQAKHPAPLPVQPEKQSVQAKGPPPKPGLKISRVQSGIVLSWNMTVSDTSAAISSYQLFAYQETSAPPATSLWKKVGDVKALPLPMACTLTQFQEGNKYHFAVRAVDAHSRVGPFSEPSSIALTVINVS